MKKIAYRKILNATYILEYEAMSSCIKILRHYRNDNVDIPFDADWFYLKEINDLVTHVDVLSISQSYRFPADNKFITYEVINPKRRFEYDFKIG